MPRNKDRNRRRNRPASSKSWPKGERRDKRGIADQSSAVRTVKPQTPGQLRAVERLLSGIGIPEQRPLKPDPFQLEALAAIEHEDVLVTAPTGSGKTWIAREEIRRLLAAGLRAWYTTPLKALTNSKYAEFCLEFGADNVCILTGDRKENTGAPLIVGRT